MEDILEKIVKIGSKWQVQSEKGRNMGTYDTKAEAEERLRQIHYFKYANEELLENLKAATAYMLRNDGKLFECPSYHPYIIMKDDKETLNRTKNKNYIIDELFYDLKHYNDLKWFYNNTLNAAVKEKIKIIIKTLINLNYFSYNELWEPPEEMIAYFSISDQTPVNTKLEDVILDLDSIDDSVNQEFCRVRTSAMFLGGSSQDIYFRISSKGFNWFNLIWNVVLNSNATTVTVVKDFRGTEKESFYLINGKKLDHISKEEFLTLNANPIIENLDSNWLKEVTKINKYNTLDEMFINKPSIHLSSYIKWYLKGGMLEEDLNHILEYNPKLQLLEDNRAALVNKSRNVGLYKNSSRGKNRFERKKYSKIANTVKQYNQIDMNKLFKEDTLQVAIPVVGETDNYTVTIKMEGVISELARNIKNNNNKFEFKTIIQALTKIFNTQNIYVKCNCDDYKYRFAHWNIVNNVSVDDTANDPGPGKGIRNPKDDQGRGCKHVLLCLNNGDWLMKVASVINNYVHYAEEHLQKPFLKVIFPKLYGIPADEMVEQGLVDNDKYLDSSTGLIDAINDFGRNRGKYQKGSNKNPVTGTGGRSKKEENEEEE